MEEPIELKPDPVVGCDHGAELAALRGEVAELHARMTDHERALALSNQGLATAGRRRLRLVIGTARRRTTPRGQLHAVEGDAR
jgi:hypothetical protein